MTRITKLQLVGPIALFAIVLSAEGAAWALAQFPASEILWFINLRLFGLFQICYYLVSNKVTIPYLQFFVAFAMLVLALTGFALKYRLLLNIASNLSFLCVCFIGYAWSLIGSPAEAASLVEQSYAATTLTLPSGSDLCLFVILIGATLPSFAASHLSYFREVRAGH